MDWMYRNSTKVDPEEFLLGRSLDKSDFKDPSPTNYMRSIKDEPGTSHSQADISRKMKEDPLTALKEKEMEEKKLLFQKLQLKRTEHLIPVSVTSMKGQETQSKSIEQLIIENLKKLSEKIDLEEFHADLKKKKKLKKSRDRVDETKSKSKTMPKKHSHVANYSSTDSSNSDIKESRSTNSLKDRDDYRSERRQDRGNYRYDSNRDYKEKIKERTISRYESKDNLNKNRKSDKFQNENTSKCRGKDRACESNDRDRTTHFERKRSRSRDRKRNSSREDYRRCTSKRSESPEISRRKEKKQDEQSKHHSRRDSPKRKIEETSKDKSIPPKKQKLSEKEKETKRREMMENAVQRNTERKQNVRKYALEDERENKNNDMSFRSEEFSRAQLSAYVSSENSIEQRIKSNVKNIQRGRSDMDRNFARRH